MFFSFLKVNSIILDNNGKKVIVKQTLLRFDAIKSVTEYVRPSNAKFTKDYPALSVVKADGVNYFCLETVTEIETALRKLYANICDVQGCAAFERETAEAEETADEAYLDDDQLDEELEAVFDLSN